MNMIIMAVLEVIVIFVLNCIIYIDNVVIKWGKMSTILLKFRQKLNV